MACDWRANDTIGRPPRDFRGTAIEKDYEIPSFRRTQPRSTTDGIQWCKGPNSCTRGTVDDGKDVPHRVVTTVTDLTKVIDGVETVVVWEHDYEGEELVEAEIAFFGQDEAGNIWLIGEYPEEYVDGKIINTPTWIYGLQDARPGFSCQQIRNPEPRITRKGWVRRSSGTTGDSYPKGV